MYIERVPNRNSPPCILLRESVRQGGRVLKHTLANLTSWPADLVANFQLLLQGGRVLAPGQEPFVIERSQPHGHIAAALGMARVLGMERLLASRPSRERDLALALVLARLLDPRSKLATARALAESTAWSSLAPELGLGEVDEDDLYGALDWLGERQGRIEQKLARRHLAEGQLVLYDLTSTYFEGRHCPLAQLGYSRDGQPEKPQIVFGLLCTGEGCPVAVEVFEGNRGDPSTLRSQLEKLSRRFGLKQLVLVGDRGLITQARIREELQVQPGWEWITALRAPQIQKLARQGYLQLSLFDERDLAEIASSDFPGERLIVCRNPLLAEERKRKREELLQSTAARLQEVVQATCRPRRPLRGKEHIALRVGRILSQYKVGKHFKLHIEEDSFSFERQQEQINEEAALDGIYVIRTSVRDGEMAATQVVRNYKRLSQLEQAFRSWKSQDLKVRPIYHRLANRVRAHLFLCLLAYYLEWWMRRKLAPLLFDEEDRERAEGLRDSVVAAAQRSPQTLQKVRSRLNSDGLPVHSFRTLLADLATLTKNRIRPNLPHAPYFEQMTQPTTLQQKALELLGVRL